MTRNRWPDFIAWSAFAGASCLIGAIGVMYPWALVVLICAASWVLLVAIGMAMARRP